MYAYSDFLLLTSKKKIYSCLDPFTFFELGTMDMIWQVLRCVSKVNNMSTLKKRNV